MKIRNRKAALLLFVLPILALQGCIMQYAVLPDVPQPTIAGKSKATAGISVVDARNEEKIGTIGAAGIGLKDGAEEYVEEKSRALLASRGITLVNAPNPDKTKNLKSIFNSAILHLELSSVSIKSFDAILDPADTTVDIDARVYNRAGKNIVQRSCHGTSKKTIGLSMTGKTEGVAISMAIDEALNRCLYDEELLNALRR